LSAVDSVIVVIDVAKGVEEQTEKLVEVCRMRKIPIIVFINKLDREGKDAFDLLDEVEQKLGLRVTPLSFPIGMGYDFKGIYNIWEKNINLFTGDNKQTISEAIHFEDVNNPELENYIGDSAAETLREELELAMEVYPSFNRDEYLNGELQPVFFGSALNNFGVRELLDCFVEIAPTPLAKESDTRLVQPNEDDFSGFVFKIHANMDPKHRDRLAFIKIVSGVFKRNTPYLHVRLDKKLKFSSPNAFFAEKKQIVDESFPGDIVGLHDTGNFKIGDTLTAGEKMNYKGVPSFSHGRKVIGTVGALQYEVIQYRLEHEYGAKCSYENLNVHKACWVEVDNEKDPEFLDFKRVKQKFLARDKENKLVFFADSSFSLQMTQQKYPKIKFHFTSEF